MDLETLAIAVGDLQGEGFMEPGPSTRDRSEGDLVVEGGGSLKEASYLFNTEDGREPMFGLRTQERQGVPVVREDVRVEEADTTVTEAHGSWGKAIDVFAMEAIALQFRCGYPIGRFAVELSEEAHLTDIGLLGALALADELKRSHHALTQWGQKLSPFGR